jgi:plastocyanin
VAVVAVLGGGCTSAATRAADRAAAQQQSSSSTTAPAPGPAAIKIKNFKFGPDPLKVKAGAVIQVTNADDTAHTVTADAGGAQMFDTKNVAGGATTTITITAAGTYKYHCDIHNYMTGVIQVAA